MKRKIIIALGLTCTGKQVWNCLEFQDEWVCNINEHVLDRPDFSPAGYMLGHGNNAVMALIPNGIYRS